MSVRSGVTAVLLGAATGVRSLGGLVALAERVADTPRVARRGLPARLLGAAPVRAVVRAAAAGEILADKVAPLPPRDTPLPLAGRLVLGGLAGVVAADLARGSRGAGALLGAGAAGLTSLGATALRRDLTDAGVPDPAVAVAEDAAVAVLGWTATRLL